MSETTDRLDEIFYGEIPETKEEFQKIIDEVYTLTVKHVKDRLDLTFELMILGDTV